ncbi:MAG: glycerol-3-phosphate dehydrogenase [Sandaracinaceae bacterium]|nr:glycerol-3-phosphate dehydrogenase [Sandaracinaceae bacterium]
MNKEAKPLLNRKEAWDAMCSHGSPYDLLVIGGGINGAGIAREAARRGLSVLLCEQYDLAFGTSSRSSKLIHGGLRYLEHGAIRLVFESVQERGGLLRNAPHLVEPLGFMIPVYANSKPGLWLLRTGVAIYEGLSFFRSPEPSSTLSPNEAIACAPHLREEGLKGAILYYDCATDDARLTLETAVDAAEHGAHIATWTRVEKLESQSGKWIDTALLCDTLSGERHQVCPRIVVSATGPWTDRLLRLVNPESHWLRPTKGIHIVFAREKLPVSHCVACFHPDDRRYLFVIPWGTHTYVGTTDTDDPSPPEEVRATFEDVRYLLRAISHYFPKAHLSAKDVISTWAGLRPLIDPGKEVRESDISREERIELSPEGILVVAGGKLTTYRLMAERIVDRAIAELRHRKSPLPSVRPSGTLEAPLPGAQNWPKGGMPELIERLVSHARGKLPSETVKHLAKTYGTRAQRLIDQVLANPLLAEPLRSDGPEILAQVEYALREEFAATISDILFRRTQIAWRSRDQGREAAKKVANHAASVLGWNQERLKTELERFEKEASMLMAWKNEAPGHAIGPESGFAAESGSAPGQ